MEIFYSYSNKKRKMHLFRNVNDKYPLCNNTQAWIEIEGDVDAEFLLRVTDNSKVCQQCKAHVRKLINNTNK